jgi:membrane protein YdbS with pleckstrin-like domain
MIRYAVRQAARSQPRRKRGQQTYAEEALAGQWLLVTPFIYVMGFLWHWSTGEIIVVPTVIIIVLGLIFSIAQQHPHKPTATQAEHLRRMTEHQRILQAQRAWEAQRLAQMADWKKSNEKWRGAK